MFSRFILTLLFCISGLASVSAKAPAAPTNFRVTPLGVNAFLLEWDDKSKNETGWEFRISLGVTKTPERFQLIATPNITSYLVTTSPLPGEELSFQMAAYNGPAGAEVFSKRTPVIVAKTFAKSTFEAPVQLTAKALDDGRVRLTWKDMATAENGYQIEAKKGFEAWAPVHVTNPGVKFSVDLYNIFEPGATYSFRVRAFKNNPVVFSGYSNTASTNMLPFLAPGDLAAAPYGEGNIVIKWKDRSFSEAGYEVESKSGNAAFSKLWESGPNVSSLKITGLSTNTKYDYRVRAFRVVNGSRVYSGYSKVASTKTSYLYKPTGLAASVVNDESVRLTWTDASARESQFVIQYRVAGTSEYSTAGFVAQNTKEYTVTGLDSRVTYDFRVGATDYVNPSYSSVVQATTKHGLIGNMRPPIITNQKFLYQIQLSTLTGLTSVTVTNLPAGLVYNTVTRTISGMVTTSGTYTATITANFGPGKTSTRSLVLQTITGSPVAVQSFSSVNLAPAAVSKVALKGKFADPDTQSAARVVTTSGTFDIILFPDSTPITTNNFLDYVDAGHYDDSFIHRAHPDFVVQGGGFKHTTTAGFSRIPTSPAIQNEPGLSNVRGTVAMAKLGGQPNSATSQFFVNLDNLNAHDPSNPSGPNLDTQNGGFTVFGRVAGTGMSVLDAIDALPRGNYSVTVGDQTADLENVPINAASAPTVLDPAQLVKITSVGPAPILTYQVLSLNTGVATAAMHTAGTHVVITGVAVGNTTVQVTAKDLDGQTTTQNIPVSVQ